MIGIMGAAGNVGSKVADLLLEAGEEIRVLQHTRELSGLAQRGAGTVTGDAMDGAALRALFSGAAAALVLLPENIADPSFVENRVVMSRAIRDCLRAEEVEHVVALSSVGAERADVPGPPGGLHTFEEDLSELGSTNLLVLRSAAYLDYLLAALPMIKAQGVNGSAIRPDVQFPMVATVDVARVAADRLTKRDFEGHEVRLLLGPEDVTMTQVTRAIGSRIGLPDLPYVEFPPDGVKSALVGTGMSEQVARLLVDMQLGVNEGIFQDVVRTPESTTPTYLDDFLDPALAEEATGTKE